MSDNAPPLVSVVIPTYNYGRFVTEAVDSALSQTYRPIEVIVVDDGSTDDTAERLKPYGGKIRYIHQQNRGLSGARNTGIREARGEYVAFLDSDDTWTPDKIAAQMRLVRDGGFEAAVCRGVATRGKVAPLDLADCFLVSPGFGSTGLVKRSLFAEVGDFDESLRSVEDRDMMLRLTRSGRRIAVAHGDYVTIRTHASNMSRKAGTMERYFRFVLRKAFAWPETRYRLGLRARAYAFFYWDSAWTHFMEGDRWKAFARLCLSLMLYPLPGGPDFCRWPFGRWKVLARIVFGDRLLGLNQDGQGGR